MSKTTITEVSSGAFFADEFFRRAFADDLPPWGHHLVFFYRSSTEHFIPLGYLNILQHEDVMLVGGGVTNGQAFRQVESDDALQIRENGGVLFQLLRYAFETYADKCKAFFGHAGNARALEVDLQAGFTLTQYEHLIVNFHKPLSDTEKSNLIEKIHALGSF